MCLITPLFDLSPVFLSLLRALALGAWHPAPRTVLMIGLGSGSWATVIADNPSVQELTIVEINPGYLQLIAKYPQVADILVHPKVHIIIDDGRRWMVRNPHRKFDAIVANTAVHWRAQATNVLSTEFLELARSRLAPGGILYYNTTGSSRAQKTGATAFPYALRAWNFLVTSETPIVFNEQRFFGFLKNYHIHGQPLFDFREGRDRLKLQAILKTVAMNIEDRKSILARTRRFKLIDDDNMGDEWEKF